MNHDELIEDMRRTAPKFGMTEEAFFTTVHDILKGMQACDAAGIIRQAVNQKERMERQREELDKKIKQGARRANGPLEFPL